MYLFIIILLQPLNNLSIADFLPKNIEAEILQNVVVLLVNVNISYTYGYLQPLDGHKNVYLFNQGGEQTELVTYYIGKYGVCPAAVRKISSRFVAQCNPSTIVIMANQCFINLDAIISVGVACGIKRKTQLCDILVSSKFINYDYDMRTDDYLPKGEAVTVSNSVVRLFTQTLNWPDDAIKEYLKVHTQRMPNVKSGVILRAAYPINNPAVQSLLNKADEVIGIEMDRVNLFGENKQTTLNTITVKAVCDFGDRKDIEAYQPIAALLAADLVHKGLSHSQAPEILKGLAI